MSNPIIIFSIGSRIFKNAQSLNQPQEPINCEETDDDCTRSAYGYRSVYDPKKKKCVCVRSPEFYELTMSCEERFKDPNVFGYNKYVMTKDNCCCDCDQSLKQDCENRGWVYIESFSTFDPQSCKCDCEERNIFDESLYISEDNCPPGKWDSDRCYCDCVGSCYEGQTMGPNCICTCDPLIIPPSGCGTDDKGKTGIFDNKHCECVYPCQPGLTPYFCTRPNGDRYIGCSDCKENEHLSSCDSRGIRHCCEYGFFYKEDEYGYDGKCVQCTPDNYPSCEGNSNKVNPLTCSCCPENYIWDAENQQCILDCDSVYDPENGNYFDQSLCVSPRQITDNCECVCPNGDIWGYDIDNQIYTCLSPQDRCPEYDPETGDPIGPLDNDGIPLYTRWDSIDKECQCQKGNIDINDCQPYQYLNTQSCECYCPEGTIEPGIEANYNECLCEPNKVRRVKLFQDIGDLRLPCVTCTELLGQFANPDIVDDTCSCQDGYRPAKTVVADPVGLTIISPDCVSCEDYTDNGIWNGSECDCAPGFTKYPIMNTNDFECGQNETPTPSITPP